MKNLLYFIFPLVFVVISQGCSLVTIKGSGVFIDEERTPSSSFTGVSSGGDFKVIILKDSTRHLSLHGEDNILDEVVTEVENGKLIIRYKSDKIRFKHKEITIKVYTPELSEIVLSGSGNMECADDFTMQNANIVVSGSGNIVSSGLFTANAFEAKVSGSGKLTANVACATNTSVSVSGSGDAILSGTSNAQTLVVSGSGSIDCLAMPTQTCSAKVSGSGNCKVNVATQLDVTISGSGDVSYKGNPSITQNISGSGKLIHL